MTPVISAPEQFFAEFFFGASLVVSLTYLLFLLFLPVLQGLSRVFRRREVLKELDRTRDNYLSRKDPPMF